MDDVSSGTPTKRAPYAAGPVPSLLPFAGADQPAYRAPRMHHADRPQLAKRVYEAFAAGDRDTIERLLADDFSFHAPPDPQLDRAGYFERCWPHSGGKQRFEFVRLIESGDEVVVTYEGTRPDGSGFRNTEVLTFAGDQVRRTEVYFGWDLA